MFALVPESENPLTAGRVEMPKIEKETNALGALAPNKKDELERLGIRSMLAGTMANLMSASLVGIVLR